MRGRTVWLGVAVMIAVVGIFLMGCATAPSGRAGKSQSDLLSQAGFTAYTPKTSEKLAYVNTLPGKKVVSNKYKGQVCYLVCTDPDSKQCYLGDKAAYQRYQQLAIQESLAAEQHQVSEERSDPEFWSLWVDSQGGP
jgi:hypothetical protein